MKKEHAALLILLGAVCHVIAQQQTSAQASTQNNLTSALQTNTAATATVVAAQAKIHLLGPANREPSQRLKPIEGLDPRAWTTVAETRTSREAFPSGETHHAGLCLIWWGSEPQYQ